MTRVRQAFAALGITVLAGCATLPGAIVQDDSDKGSAKQKYALMIGINKYSGAPLSGCLNDVEDLKQALGDLYGFPTDERHMKALLDEEATKKNIIDAFRTHLIENAKKHPDGTFLFSYSGHGSYTLDKNGDEPDGVDETICPIDSRDPGVFDLVDDELDELCEELTKYTPNATFILDSCHSGTAVRDLGIKPRRIAADSRPQPEQKPLPKSAEKGKVQAGMLPRSSKYVLISGCRHNETSADARFESPEGVRPNGALTYFLVQTLRDRAGNLTFRELWEGTCRAVAEAGFEQHPQIEGDLDRYVFGGNKERTEPFIGVSSASGRSVTIKAGSAHGLRKGGLVALYKPEATKFVGNDNLIATGKVTEVENFTSTVEIPADLDAAALKAAKVVIVTPDFGAQKLRVRLQASPAPTKAGSPPSQFVDGLNTKLKTHPLIDFMGTATTLDELAKGVFDVAIIKDSYGTFAQSLQADASARGLSKKEQGYFLISRDGRPLYDFFVSEKDSDAAGKVVQALEKRAKQENVRSLSNSVSPLNDGLNYKVIRVVGSETDGDGKPVPKEEVRSEDQLGSPVLTPGDKIRVAVTNKTGKYLYITVLSLGSAGNIQVVYPPAGANQAISPDREAKTPVIEVAGPPGVETFKFIATTEPVDFSFLGQSGLKEVGSEGKSSALKSLLLKAYGVSGKGGEFDAPSLDDWVTARLDCDIRKKATK